MHIGIQNITDLSAVSAVRIIISVNRGEGLVIIETQTVGYDKKKYHVKLGLIIILKQHYKYNNAPLLLLKEYIFYLFFSTEVMFSKNYNQVYIMNLQHLKTFQYIFFLGGGFTYKQIDSIFFAE